MNCSLRAILWCAFATVAAVASCMPISAQSASGAHRKANPAKLDEQSCSAFVQKFYDWYWNDTAAQSDKSASLQHGYEDALRLRPLVLSPELVRLIERDQRRSEAAGGDIINLDFDPFLNSQDPRGKYMVDRATLTATGCTATLSRQNVVVELKRYSSGWRFTNFHYRFFSEDGKTKESPDTDLIHILSR